MTESNQSQYSTSTFASSYSDPQRFLWRSSSTNGNTKIYPLPPAENKLSTETSALYSARMNGLDKPITFYQGDISLETSTKNDGLPPPVIEVEPEGRGTSDTTSTFTQNGQSVSMYKAKKGSGIKHDGYLSK